MAWYNLFSPALLKPNLVVRGTIVDLDPELLARQGVQGLLLDVDHTLVPSDTRQVSPELRAWVERVRPQMPIWLVTNNLHRARIDQIAVQLDLPYLLGARKPSRRKLRQAAAAMDLPLDRLAMVGDRLFTDVLAGNRLGMFTILVEPMGRPGSRPPYNIVHLFEFWVSKLLGAPVF